jgi:hypothetical protein
MTFSGLDYPAIFWSAVAGFLVGGVWYGALSKPWLKAAGLTEEQVKGRPNMFPFLAAFGGNLLIGFGLALLLRSLDLHGAANGAVLGALICATFVLPTMTVNHVFQAAKPTLTMIDGGHWIGVLSVQGGLIGWLSG